jgi:hypothetical protein
VPSHAACLKATSGLRCQQDSCNFAKFFIFTGAVKMNTGFKYGLAFLAGLILSGVAMAGEPVPIEDRDAFEKQYIECFMSGLKDNCFISVFSGHLDRTIKNPTETLNKLNSYYLSIQKRHSSIYKIHALDKTIRAGVFDNRTYIVEHSNETLIGFNVIFVNRKGNWYAYSISMKDNDNDEFLYEILNLPTLSTK